jgi:glycosyltransferase involved in cell wall biosynthesis
MDQNRFSNILCSLTTPDEYQYRINPERRHIYNLNKKQGNDFTLPFKIASIIKKEHIDIVHSRGWPAYMEGILAAKLMCRQVKFVFSYHGRTIDDVQYIPKRRLKTQRILSFFVDCIMTLSEEMAKEYASLININGNVIRVIHNGVDTDKFTIKKKRSDRLRKELNIENDDYVIGFVGRINPVKDLQTLIDSVSIAKTYINSIKLIIVGEGDERPRLQDYVSRNGLENKVIFTGQRDDIADCLSIMDLYIQPSLYEGMSNTIVEAMATRRTVLATNVGGTPELLEHEVDGILFTPGNPEELADYIKYFYDNPEKAYSLANNAYTKAIKQFSIPTMVKNYENLYMGLVS